MATSVHFYHRDMHKRYEIASITTSITISGSADRYYRSAILRIADKEEVPYETGERVRIYQNKKLLFEGRVFRIDHSSKDGVTLTCYDNAYYLLKNSADFTFSTFSDTFRPTLSNIFRHVCKVKGIKAGFVKNTKTEFRGVQFVNQDLQTVFQTLIGLERQETGKKHYIRSVGNTLELRERGDMEGVVIDTDMTYEIMATKDAQDMYTSIKVNATERRTASSEDKKTATIFGINSQHYKGPDATNYQSGFRSRLKACDIWDGVINEVAKERGVDALMLKVLVMMESSGKPDGINSLGAMGLTQIIPERVDEFVNAARLLEPKYNLEKCADILLGEKLRMAKSRGLKASVTNMIHFWNGWDPATGDGDSAYAATFRVVYSGFGGDADKLFTSNSGTNSTGKKDKEYTYDYRYGDVVEDAALLKKLGRMTKVVHVQFDGLEGFSRKLANLKKELREKQEVSLDCIGHIYGISGRKVHFRTNRFSKGTWYIKSDTHVIDQYGHKMSLLLDKYDPTPEPEYSGTDEEKEQQAASGDIPVNARFMQPVLGQYTQYWGPASGAYGYTFHNGVDLSAPVNTPVKATAAGTVVEAGWAGDYGNRILLRHTFGNEVYFSLYAHLNSIGKNVIRGNSVNKGDVIGGVGSTGNSTGPHLHFELHKNAYRYSGTDAATSIDPRKYF